MITLRKIVRPDGIEIRYGRASWCTDPENPEYSVKVACRDCRGHISRTGEVGVADLADLVAVALGAGTPTPEYEQHRERLEAARKREDAAAANRLMDMIMSAEKPLN